MNPCPFLSIRRWTPHQDFVPRLNGPGNTWLAKASNQHVFDNTRQSSKYWYSFFGALVLSSILFYACFRLAPWLLCIYAFESLKQGVVTKAFIYESLSFPPVDVMPGGHRCGGHESMAGLM
jgi:hypothetical protein